MNYLNDSHAQLMVHWLGDGTNVMICLAREPPVGPMHETPTSSKPSSVYISYDYGDNFQDKTLLFTVLINGTEVNSTLDQFVTNQNYNTVSHAFDAFRFCAATQTPVLNGHSSSSISGFVLSLRTIRIAIGKTVLFVVACYGVLVLFSIIICITVLYCIVWMRAIQWLVVVVVAGRVFALAFSHRHRRASRRFCVQRRWLTH